MCRFLLVKAPHPIPGEEIFKQFSAMARQSRAPDGDWQGDGWGAAWLNPDRNWKVLKSLRPIWEDADGLARIPESALFLVHARSASFFNHKGVLDYNQPYVDESFGFVFNGLIQGVSFPFAVAGEIGAQKVWSLLTDFMGRFNPEESLISLSRTLEKCSRRIHALNIGLCDKKNIFASCRYVEDAGYYHLQYFDSPSLKMICSEPLPGFAFRPIPLGRVFVL